MSWGMEAVERIRINNKCEETRALIGEIKNHLSIIFSSVRLII